MKKESLIVFKNGGFSLLGIRLGMLRKRVEKILIKNELTFMDDLPFIRHDNSITIKNCLLFDAVDLFFDIKLDFFQERLCNVFLESDKATKSEAFQVNRIIESLYYDTEAHLIKKEISEKVCLYEFQNDEIYYGWSVGLSAEKGLYSKPIQKEGEGGASYFTRLREWERHQLVTESDLTPDEWKKWNEAMKEWKASNGISADETGPQEIPVRDYFRESFPEFFNRKRKYERMKSLWETAPKLSDFRNVCDGGDYKVSVRFCFKVENLYDIYEIRKIYYEKLYSSKNRFGDFSLQECYKRIKKRNAFSFLLLLMLFGGIFFIYGQCKSNNVKYKKQGFYSSEESGEVYICTSLTATKYHRTATCRWLGGCSEDIISVSKEEAEESDKTPCKGCYEIDE